MAVTKIKPVKGGLKKALDYIQNPDKTDDKMLVSSFGCGYETAYEEFTNTLSNARDKGNNLAHHLIQSFEPGESTPEQAHEIGRRLADELTKGRHEYVLTTHIDKGHVHNHLIFCAASFIDHKKYISNKKSYYEIRNFSDKLCKEYGLAVLSPTHDKDRGAGKGKHYAEHAADMHGGGSWKSKLKLAIDDIIPQSKDFEDFLKRLEDTGHEIKRGKYISVRAPGQERFTRTKTLGADYTEESITKRIAGDYVLDVPAHEQGAQERGITPTAEQADNVIDFAAATDTPDIQVVDSGDMDIVNLDTPGRGDIDSADIDINIFAVHKADGNISNTTKDSTATKTPASSTPSERTTYTRPAPAVNLIKDIENCVKAQQSAGFERWQKIQNLKEAAKTLNFLTENNLLQYSALENKTAEVAAAFDSTADTLKAAEKRLADMAALLKNISTYQQTKPIIDGLTTTKNKDSYRREHQSAFILHEAAAKALKAHAGEGGKLPNPAALQAEYNRLTEKKNALRTEYGKLQKQAQEYGIVKKNVDSILNPGTERARGRARQAEL